MTSSLITNSYLNRLDIKIIEIQDKMKIFNKIDIKYNEIKSLLAETLKEINTNTENSVYEDIRIDLKNKNKEINEDIQNKIIKSNKSLDQSLTKLEIKINSYIKDKDNTDQQGLDESLDLKIKDIEDFLLSQKEKNRVFEDISQGYNDVNNKVNKEISNIYSNVDGLMMRNSEIKETFISSIEKIESKSNEEINQIKKSRVEFEENVFGLVEEVYIKLTVDDEMNV